MNWATLIVLCNFVSFISAGRYVPPPLHVGLFDYQGYINDVCMKFMESVEKLGLSALPLPDFAHEVNVTYPGVGKVTGNVNFMDGFVVSLSSASIKPNSINEWIQVEKDLTKVEVLIEMYGIDILYDFKALLTNYTMAGNVLVKVPRIGVKLYAEQTVTQKNISSHMRIVEATASSWNYLPNNSYTTIFQKNKTFPTFEIYNTWAETIFEPMLDENILPAIPYPDICYNCLGGKLVVRKVPGQSLRQFGKVTEPYRIINKNAQFEQYIKQFRHGNKNM